MKIVSNMQQGSSDWLQFRATRFGSSEAAAMLGLSPYTTRSELLRMKHTGLSREFSDWVQRNILDKGHAVEAATRPMVEDQIGDILYPATVQGPGRLVGSCDGLTLDGAVLWECKQWNGALAAAVQAGSVPDTHMPQCQHLLLVTGAERLLFTVSDGSNQMVSTEVHPDPAWFQRLIQGWDQFEKDLASYVPKAIPEPARAEQLESLPAVAVRLNGALTVAGNLPMFAVALKDFIAKMPAKPATDNDFATTDAACKALKKAEEALDAAEAGALASITDVEVMRRAVADCRKLARDTRLAAEKLVERRKTEIKEQAVAAARRALDEHVAGLNGELAPMAMRPVVVDFAGAIKGLRSIASMQDALDTALAGGKIAADQQSRCIRANVAAFKSAAGEDRALQALFVDLGQLVHKAADDFAAVLDQRITRHRADEAERARKAAEQQARLIAEAERRAAAEAEARVRAEQEALQQRERDAAEAELRRIAAEDASAQGQDATEAPKDCTEGRGSQQVLKATPETADATDRDVNANVSPLGGAMGAGQPAASRPIDEPATLNLGTISARLGFTVTANFLATIGVQYAAQDKAAKLYRPSDFGRVCDALVAHITKAKAAA